MTAQFRAQPATRLGLVLLGLFAVLAGGPTARADEWFLKIDGMPGTLTDGPLAGWTPVTSAGAIVRRPQPTNPAAGPAAFFCRITKPADPMSPRLLQSCGVGQRLARVSLAQVRTPPGATQYRITLENALVSSFQHAAPGPAGTTPPDPAPLEDITFEFEKLEWACLTLNDAGGTTGGLAARINTATGEGDLKTRLPFRATIDRQAGQAGVLITVPVERSHRYRILASPAPGSAWKPVQEFTATEDGPATRFVSMDPPTLLLRIEEID